MTPEQNDTSTGVDFADALVTGNTEGLAERFFDRFMFNLHPTDNVGPSLIVGAGVYPGRDVIDGFVVAVTGAGTGSPEEQRNVRFSTALSAAHGTAVGPFVWSVEKPMQQWRLKLGPNPERIELDAVWTARAPAWVGDVTVRNGAAAVSSFEHLFQSGTYEGALTIDGTPHDITGWFGQRDRSRGVRTMSGGQGLHLWVQAQFADRSVGFLLVEGRDYRRLLLEGAVMHTNGELDAIVDVRHDLVFDSELDLRGGRFIVEMRSGRIETIEVSAGTRGGYMAGGGYGGHHGKPYGIDHLEHDRYALDGTVSPKTVDTALTDRVARFESNGDVGYGVLEFAHSRSASYTYGATTR